MKIKNDSYFEIGKTHTICEDYAISGNINGISYGIVVDGCSSSNEVDIGARILAKVVQKNISTLDEKIFNENLLNCLYDNIRNNIIDGIKHYIDELNLCDSAFDCTLLLMLSNQEKCIVLAYGDGNIIIRNKNFIKVINISYSSNAPYYISYFLNPKRLVGYCKEFETSKIIINKEYENFIDNEKENTTFSKSFDIPLIFTFPNDNIDTISILSDGLETFMYDYHTFKKY